MKRLKREEYLILLLKCQNRKYMIPQTNILNDHYKGSTFKGLRFIITYNTVRLDLTGATIRCQFRRKSPIGDLTKELNIGTGITVTDAVNGVFRFDEMKINWDADIYYYDIEIALSNGNNDTYVKGTINVIQDSTWTI